MDRTLIGLFVEREVESRMSWSHFAAHSGISRATLYRVKEGDQRVTQRVLRQLERALDLPFDALTAVGVHDWNSTTKRRSQRGDDHVATAGGRELLCGECAEHADEAFDAGYRAGWRKAFALMADAVVEALRGDRGGAPLRRDPVRPPE